MTFSTRTDISFIMDKPSITNQDLFNLVYNGLKGQGFKQSLAYYPDHKGSGEVMCAYRGEGGCKCAVGHIIPDENYSTFLEGKRIHLPEVRKAIPYTLTGSQWDMLVELQRAHDHGHSNNAKNMKAILARVADGFYVSVPEGL